MPNFAMNIVISTSSNYRFRQSVAHMTRTPKPKLVDIYSMVKLKPMRLWLLQRTRRLVKSNQLLQISISQFYLCTCFRQKQFTQPICGKAMV